MNHDDAASTLTLDTLRKARDTLKEHQPGHYHSVTYLDEEGLKKFYERANELLKAYETDKKGLPSPIAAESASMDERNEQPRKSQENE